jgi:hypothetical protein
MDFNRSTEGETAEAITNILSRGGTEDWKSLYSRASRDRGFRSELRRRLTTIDTEISPGAPGLWTALLDAMDLGDAGGRSAGRQ